MIQTVILKATISYTESAQRRGGGPVSKYEYIVRKYHVLIFLVLIPLRFTFSEFTLIQISSFK